MFYACAFILVFSVLFDQVRAVNIFNFRLIRNSTHNKWSSDAMAETFSTRPVYINLYINREIRDTTHDINVKVVHS